ncbi:STAS domain-containing protein [Streptomyces broussonetiae]|uniref:STAS domain-containing protein n=1 Tax=Streptomyces broussonetiae TaxID=2686304 RepID=A0A6I6NMG6_9ACTN|nr:STAS domain-containing protein [Streptomyces broussonetiae]QHA09107.1 STAS domain-containing protein [Streptomyces broussonetiae]
MPRPLRVMVNAPEPDHCVLTAAGELNVVTAAELRAVLQQAVTTYPRTVVDLAGSAFCDCSGLSARLAASRHARERGAVLWLRSVPYAGAPFLRLAHPHNAFTSESRHSHSAGVT